MPYRVETASSGRAVCRATECKTQGIKIEKDELRLGSWVDFGDRASWTWKHWGCVTGKQIQNLRASLQDPETGEYDWDMLDGYSSGDKNSLDKHPDLQEKVRRVISQGFIDPEDFNGDPDMNKLGATGLRSPATKKKMREEEKELKRLEEELETAMAEQASADAKVAAIKNQIHEVKTGGRKSLTLPERDAEAGAGSPKAKKRAGKAKKEEVDDDAEVKPVAKKSRAKKVKEEDKEFGDSDNELVTHKPAKKLGAKKVAKKEEDDGSVGNSEGKAKGPPSKKRGRKAIKEEDGDELSLSDVKPAVKRTRRGKGEAKRDAEAETKVKEDSELEDEDETKTLAIKDEN